MSDVLDYFAQETFTSLLTQNLSRDDPVSRSLGNGACVFFLSFFLALSLSSYLHSCPNVSRLLKITQLLNR